MGMVVEMPDGSNIPETITVEITNSDVKNLNVGQKVEVLVKGSVGMLQIPPEGPSKERPALVGVRVTDKEVKGLNQFAKMVEDDEKDEEEE